MVKKISDTISESFFSLFTKKGIINVWKFTHLEHLILGLVLWEVRWWLGLFFLLIFIGYNSLSLMEIKNNIKENIKNIFKGGKK